MTVIFNISRNTLYEKGALFTTVFLVAKDCGTERDSGTNKFRCYLVRCHQQRTVTSENSFLVCRKSAFHCYKADTKSKWEGVLHLLAAHTVTRRTGQITGWMHGEVWMQLFLCRQHYWNQAWNIYAIPMPVSRKENWVMSLKQYT